MSNELNERVMSTPDEKLSARELIYKRDLQAKLAWRKENPAYQAKAFSSLEDMTDWLNSIAKRYTLVSIADTNAYVTAAVRRINEEPVWFDTENIRRISPEGIPEDE